MYTLGVSENTAQAEIGVRTFARRRLELFVLGSVLATLGGAVYAGTQLFVPPTLVQATAELSLLIMLFVGGRRSVLGSRARRRRNPVLRWDLELDQRPHPAHRGRAHHGRAARRARRVAGIVSRLWRRVAPRLPFTGLASTEAVLVPPPGSAKVRRRVSAGELAVADETQTSAFRRTSQRGAPMRPPRPQRCSRCAGWRRSTAA